MVKLDLNPVRVEIVRQGIELSESTIFTVYYNRDIKGHKYAVIEIYDKYHFKGFVTVMEEDYDDFEGIALKIIERL